MWNVRVRIEYAVDASATQPLVPRALMASDAPVYDGTASTSGGGGGGG